MDRGSGACVLRLTVAQSYNPSFVQSPSTYGYPPPLPDMLLSRNWNGPEYEARLKKPFSPPSVTLKEIHDAVPKHLLKPNAMISTYYVLRDIVLTVGLVLFASRISPWTQSNFGGYVTSDGPKALIKSSLWLTYWWGQGLVGSGLFCLGHDAGHGTLYENSKVNNTIGFVMHTALLVPYFAWRSTHHAHHKATGSMERDENYVPYLRQEYSLPEESTATQFDYAEVFEETPILTFSRIFIMQGFGWWVYLSHNTMGSKMYPLGTNHFSPSSPLFKPEQRNSIIISNVGLVGMLTLLAFAGPSLVLRYYLIPYLLTNHWIVMFTYLHHSDPTIPHYRKGEWTFLRGAAATVDRPLLGWMGRFFFHNISHDHVAHHFFAKAPFYNGPHITAAIRSVLKDDYNYDSTNTLYALYRSFTQCQFVEADGDIIFYKNGQGIATREVDHAAIKRISDTKIETE